MAGVGGAAGRVIARVGQPRSAIPVERYKGGIGTAARQLDLAGATTDLDLGALWQTADASHDGLARALDPVHTLADAIFAVSTRRIAVSGSAERCDAPRAWRDSMIGLQAMAARVVQAAVLDGLANATAVTTPAFTLPSYPFASTEGRGWEQR